MAFSCKDLLGKWKNRVTATDWKTFFSADRFKSLFSSSKKSNRAKGRSSLGGPMIVPAVFVGVATSLLLFSLTLIILDPPKITLSFLTSQIFVDDEKPDKETDLPDDTSSHQETLLFQTLPADDAYMDSICYLGDSITYGMGAYGFSDKNSTFGNVGMNQSGALTTPFIELGQGRLLTMAEAVEILKPKRIVLLIGVNGVAWMGEQTFKSTYQDLITDIKNASPNSILILESVLPVTYYSETYVEPRISNQKINRCNELIYELAVENHCFYLNTAEVFKDVEGYGDASLYNADGMHINKNGYEKMLEYIRTHAVG